MLLTKRMTADSAIQEGHSMLYEFQDILGHMLKIVKRLMGHCQQAIESSLVLNFQSCERTLTGVARRNIIIAASAAVKRLAWDNFNLSQIETESSLSIRALSTVMAEGCHNWVIYHYPSTIQYRRGRAVRPADQAPNSAYTQPASLGKENELKEMLSSSRPKSTFSCMQTRFRPTSYGYALIKTPRNAVKFTLWKAMGPVTVESTMNLITITVCFNIIRRKLSHLEKRTMVLM
nr:hypothetical protein L203_04567 [Cryptococcus depauperatus CBS 7841]